MNKVAYIGFGALGRQIRDIIHEYNDVQSEIYFDDQLSHPDQKPFATFTNDDYDSYEFVIGIGYSHLELRRSILTELLSLERKVANVIHPSTIISHSSSFGVGNILFPGTIIDSNVSIGDGNIFNNGVIVSHECTITDCNYFSPASVLCGRISMKHCNFIGAGALIKNDLKIGSKTVIGMGTLVNKGLKDNSRVVGNPMKGVDDLKL